MLLALNTLTLSGAAVEPGASTPAQAAPPAQAGLPDELMRALLDASAHSFEAHPDGYTARSSGLDFTLDAGGLHAGGEGFAWSLALSDLGREGQISPIGDFFGFSVVLAGDTALVGAYYDDVGANTDQGSAYIFTRSGTIWMQQAYLTASDGAVGDEFGASVALSGDTALVGAFEDVGANTNQGSVYVFVRNGTTWTQQAKLTASNGEELGYFGDSVSLLGDTALVGAPGEDPGGSAYVFIRSGTTWSLQTRLTASDGDYEDLFGVSVALSGDTALVGAIWDDVGANTDQGSAYVFNRSGTIWTQQAKLLAEDGDAEDEFGYSVALAGDTALVGAVDDDIDTDIDQGSAYIFTRSGTTWTQQAQLTAADGAEEDGFGRSVALSGDSALVGAYYDDVSANTDQGSAYIFTRSGTIWTQQSRLTGWDGAVEDRFGISAALSGDTALVGAPFHDVGANINQGSAYVFTRSGTAWMQRAQFTNDFTILTKLIYLPVVFRSTP